MKNSFQYSRINLPLNYQVRIVENKLLLKTRHNTIIITDFEWKILV